MYSSFIKLKKPSLTQCDNILTKNSSHPLRIKRISFSISFTNPNVKCIKANKIRLNSFHKDHLRDSIHSNSKYQKMFSPIKKKCSTPMASTQSTELFSKFNI